MYWQVFVIFLNFFLMLTFTPKRCFVFTLSSVVVRRFAVLWRLTVVAVNRYCYHLLTVCFVLVLNMFLNNCQTSDLTSFRYYCSTASEYRDIFYKYADFFLRCFWSVFYVWFTALALAPEMMTHELVSELESLDDEANVFRVLRQSNKNRPIGRFLQMACYIIL